MVEEEPVHTGLRPHLLPATGVCWFCLERPDRPSGTWGGWGDTNSLSGHWENRRMLTGLKQPPSQWPATLDIVFHILPLYRLPSWKDTKSHLSRSIASRHDSSTVSTVLCPSCKLKRLQSFSEKFLLQRKVQLTAEWTTPSGERFPYFKDPRRQPWEWEKMGHQSQHCSTAPSCVTPSKMLNHSEFQSILTQWYHNVIVRIN